MKNATVLVLMGLVGCADGVQLDYLPKQDQAVSILANLYGLKVSDVPPIAWVRGGCLYYRPEGCVDGDFKQATILGDQERIEVSVWPGQTWEESSLAHEVCHVLELRRTGDSDQPHESSCFNDPGTQGQIDGGMTRLGRIALRPLGPTE